MKHKEAIKLIEERIAQFKSANEYAKFLNIAPSNVYECLKGTRTIAKAIERDVGIKMFKEYRRHNYKAEK